MSALANKALNNLLLLLPNKIYQHMRQASKTTTSALSKYK